MNNTRSKTPRFSLGSVYMTPGALEALDHSEALRVLDRHVRGDWGDVPPEDHDENELSLREDFRLLSSYRSAAGVKVWVITEADRSSTTILLPSEY